jgi:hypothetical protein
MAYQAHSTPLSCVIKTLESGQMLPFSDWFPLAMAGLTFTLLGGIKLWGLNRGILGGADEPAVQRLCGT